MHGVLVFVIMMVNMAFLGEIKAKDVDLYLHQQGLDTSTPAGRAMFQMLGVFSEFERAQDQGSPTARASRCGRSPGTWVSAPPASTPPSTAMRGKPDDQALPPEATRRRVVSASQATTV